MKTLIFTEESLNRLEAILKDKGEHNPHYYLNGVHPQHNTQRTYGWIKKGQDNVVQSDSRRQ